jgi:hypothetical protein
MIRFFSCVVILIFSTETASATCNYIFREQFDAIDGAMTCNYLAYHLPEGRGATITVAGGRPIPVTRIANPRILQLALQRGVYTELSELTKIELRCRATAYSQMLGNEQQMNTLLEAARRRFADLYIQTHNLRDQASANLSGALRDAVAERERNPRANGPGEGGAQISMAMQNDRRLSQALDQSREAYQKITAVPYGWDRRVAEALRRMVNEFPPNFMNDPSYADRFDQEFRRALAQSQADFTSDANRIQGLHHITHCMESTPEGAVSREVTNGTCPPNSTPYSGYTRDDEALWDGFSRAGLFETAGRNLNRVNSQISPQVFACNADRNARRREQETDRDMAYTATGWLPGADIIIAGIAGIDYAMRVRRDCGAGPSFNIARSSRCTLGLGVEEAISFSQNNDCGNAVLSLAATSSAAFFVRSSLRTADQLVTGSADNLVVGGANSLNAIDNGAQAVDEVVAGGNQIVVGGPGIRAQVRRRQELIQRAEREGYTQTQIDEVLDAAEGDRNVALRAFIDRERAARRTPRQVQEADRQARRVVERSIERDFALPLASRSGASRRETISKMAELRRRGASDDEILQAATTCRTGN